MLESLSRRCTYTGVTTDVQRRLRQHNGLIGGGAKATRAGRPWVLIHSEGPLPQGDALRREYEVKQLPAEKKLTLTG